MSSSNFCSNGKLKKDYNRNVIWKQKLIHISESVPYVCASSVNI